MSSNFLNWSQSLESGTAICGGKGYNLARLNLFGFPIPRGGVLSAKLYREIIDRPEISIKIQELQQFNDSQLASPQCTELLSEIQILIKAATDIPGFSAELEDFLSLENIRNKTLAIRSSASLEDGKDYSFAGIHQSYLNVKGTENIIDSVLKCYASLWTPRALSYRRKMSIDDDSLDCAVVITELLNADASGIAFSCHPGCGREDLTLINANFGYGESIVSGQVEPDEYQLISHHMTVDNITIGSKSQATHLALNEGTQLEKASPENANKQVLSEQQIIRLGELVQRLFWTLSDGRQHQDIEWVLDGEQFYLVQARPVTHFTPVRCNALN